MNYILAGSNQVDDLRQARKNLQEALTTEVPLSPYAESRIRSSVYLLEKVLQYCKYR